MLEILHLLEANSKLSNAEIANMLGISEGEVQEKIEYFEQNNIVIGYNTLVDWGKTDSDSLTALIEVKVTPQRGEGFDRVAERIYQFPEVSSCYLMSGGYDLGVIVEGRSLKEVARFVSEKLAPIDSVVSTATHFVLKKYKEKGKSFSVTNKGEKGAIMI